MGLSQQVGDDGELMKLVESYFQSSDNAVLLAFRVAKSQASSWTVSGRRTRLTTKPRILSVTAKRSSITQKFKVKLQVLKQTANDEVQTAKVYKLKHLSKIEAVPTDNSGCTFILGFDNLKAQAVAPPQWTMRNLDDRNRLVTCILKLSKENLGRVPKIVGMDLSEMTLWAKANAKSLPIDGPASPVTEGNRDGSRGGVDVVERELVSKAEEDDMEALLDSYVLGIDEAEAFSERLKRELTALEAANVHAILESQPLVEEVLHQLDAATNSVEDMDKWLDIFNVKLRHMREDIESIESRNNRLEMQSQNNAALGDELSKLLERLRVPSEYTTLLTAGSFEEASMPENVEACEWLAGALRGLEPPLLDPAYVSVRAVTDKRGELEKLKSTFVRRASDFLRNYFASVVDFMISDKSYFLQKGQLKRPDHADLRYKCRSYARLLQHIKTLDSNALGPLRKHYCSSLNHLLRREAHEFASELKTQVKGLPKQSGAWMEGSNSSSSLSTADTSIVSDAYSRMLRIFIPLLVDESRFFASFMCFEVVPTGPITANGAGGGVEDEDDISPLDEDGSDLKSADPNPAELEALNQALQELLVGVEEDFNVVVDWAWKTDPLRCISMHGITEKYLAIHKADAASFVRQLLTALQERISHQFNRFVEIVNNQFEKHDKSVKQAGVISYIPRFSILAQKMESLIQGNSREIVDFAYKKLVETMFAVLERIAQVDPKHADIILLENYAAFQNYMFDLANMVPVLGNYYQQASELYEQACTRYINIVINHQFERIFQFGQKVENLLYTITPEEVPFQINFSRADLRKTLSSNLKGVEKSLREMYKRMQKHLVNSDELLPSLWEKCKEDFLEKYEALEALLVKCYPSETLSPSSEEMKELFKTVG